MKFPPSTLTALKAGATALLLAPCPLAGQTTIFSDDFSGDSSDLNGTTPDVTPNGEAWVASPLFNSDGSTEDAAGSATLAFTPEDGLVYTLDASISGLGLVGGPDNDWLALGFVNGQSDASGTAHRFITGSVVGVAWIMHRGDISLGTNQNFVGTGQLGQGNFGLGSGGGENTGQMWELTPPSPDVDLRVVLDTTGGEGNYTATWYAKRASDSEYVVSRATENLLPGAVISAVGVARSNNGINATLDSFSLTSSASAGAPLQARISLQEGTPEIEIEAETSLRVDLYRSTTAEPGSWGEPITTGLENGDAFLDAEAPAGRAFYIAVSSGGSAP